MKNQEWRDFIVSHFDIYCESGNVLRLKFNVAWEQISILHLLRTAPIPFYTLLEFILISRFI